MALPLCSSSQIVAALLRLECWPSPRKQKGSHKTYYRAGPHGRTLVAVVPLGKSEVARGTLRSILTLLEIEEEAFREALI